MIQSANNVSISVETQYLSQHVSAENQYPFAYKITITNQGEQMVQLKNRYWLITDGNGKKTEVHGAGVVGKQPYIKHGESFVYTSGAVLETPIGTMEGYYEMQSEKGDWFQAPIDVFSLAVPNILN